MLCYPRPGTMLHNAGIYYSSACPQERPFAPPPQEISFHFYIQDSLCALLDFQFQFHHDSSNELARWIPSRR